MKVQRTAQAVRFDVSTEVVTLRACENCGAPHPGVGHTECGNCGEPVMTPAAPTVVPTALSGRDPVFMIGTALICVANGLRALARKAQGNG